VATREENASDEDCAQGRGKKIFHRRGETPGKEAWPDTG
jgi:hypothetical protein